MLDEEILGPPQVEENGVLRYTGRFQVMTVPVSVDVDKVSAVLMADGWHREISFFRVTDKGASFTNIARNRRNGTWCEHVIATMEGLVASWFERETDRISVPLANIIAILQHEPPEE